MSIQESQEVVRTFVNERNWKTPPSDILIHLMEEMGEVARNVLKLKNYGGQHTNSSPQNMDEELADVLYLLLKLANESEVDLNAAFQIKMEKNSKRFPVLEKSKENFE